MTGGRRTPAVALLLFLPCAQAGDLIGQGGLSGIIAELQAFTVPQRAVAQLRLMVQLVEILVVVTVEAIFSNLEGLLDLDSLPQQPSREGALLGLLGSSTSGQASVGRLNQSQLSRLMPVLDTG
ncbi:hypothetical protein CFAM422_001955 [Trichoderma lentiforme]|uniref:Uncharacterized protein n=1 Tax=Trichoderma lentiforme TaxID=1567552 RepID=A0A9P5CI22_9HYPO|nr:hypothetical protein CFAM422_001955 [Trichoderma lentiforme]